MAAVASVQDATEGKYHPNEPSIQTPPASDRSSHGRMDDAASSSELSDLDEDFEDPKIEPKTEPEPAIEPDRYENGVPVFQPVCLVSWKWIFLTLADNGSIPRLPEIHDRRQSVWHAVGNRPD